MVVAGETEDIPIQGVAKARQYLTVGIVVVGLQRATSSASVTRSTYGSETGMGVRSCRPALIPITTERAISYGQHFQMHASRATYQSDQQDAGFFLPLRIYTNRNTSPAVSVGQEVSP